MLKEHDNIVSDTFSIVNPQKNRSFYYYSKFFQFSDNTGKDEIFLTKQEQKLHQLIQITILPEKKFLVWENYIHWIHTIYGYDPLRNFALLDKFTQTFLNETKMFRNEKFISIFQEYAAQCEDEFDVNYFMLQSGIYASKGTLIEKMIDGLCYNLEYERAGEIIDHLCESENESIRMKCYEKLKNSIESKISEMMNNTILFPEVINSLLSQDILKHEDSTISCQSQLSSDILHHSPQFKVIEIKQSTEELKQSLVCLNSKYRIIKNILLEYDEDFLRRSNESEIKSLNNPKPFSWLKTSRFKPRISIYLIKNVLSYLNPTHYYQNAMKTHNSSFVHFALENTKAFPRKLKLIYKSDNLDKDCVEYMHKVNQIVYSKHDRDSYSSKISILTFINNSQNVRSLTINYAVKNLIYLYGVSDYYLGMFTPFYFILFDTKTTNFISRYRFELNHYSDENVVIYLHQYNPRMVAISIMNYVYVISIETLRDNFSVKYKLEGHKDEVTRFTYKMLTQKKLPLLLSASRTQIIMWNLDTGAIHKILSIDESKLMIKQMILINEYLLSIMTMYNQLYTLEFSDVNVIKNVKIKNFNEEEFIYSVNNEGTLVYKLNNKSFALYDIETEKCLFNFEQESFDDSDVMFVYSDYVLKKNGHKNKLMVFSLY